MIFPRPKQICLLVLLFAFSMVPVLAFGDEWRPISPAEMQMKSPKVEPDADAEAIFWEIRIDDSATDRLTESNYVRVKIFTERGREKYSKIDISYVKGVKIKDLMARVIKPDGTIVEVAQTEIFDREIAKLDKTKVKSKSFAVTGIEPGVIVEYQYKKVTMGGSANGMRMRFQYDIPIQTISYFYKGAFSTRGLPFNMEGTGFVKDKNGFHRATLNNVPALKEEPRMPPEDEVRKWVLLYWDNLKDDYRDFWARAGGYLVAAYDIKDTLKPGKELKAAATEITQGAKTPDEQLSKLYQFCKTRVKNINFDPNITEEELEKIKPNKSTKETYQKLQGRSGEINELFASLAASLDYEVRLAFSGDRSEKFFNIRDAHTSFIHFAAIAVKVGNQWRYFDPGSPFVEEGMLTWFEEDTAALLIDAKTWVRAETPISSYNRSLAKRSGKFRLSEDGTLEGTVKIEYSGHLGYVYKNNNYEDAAAKQEESLKDEIKSTISAAEVSNISIQNVTDPEKPFTYIFNVKVPGYAQKTGKRMFIQPGFFEFGNQPEFSSAARSYDLFFRFPWSEKDDVEIELPPGFALEGDEPASDIADRSLIGQLKINISYQKDKNVLKYDRSFKFGDKDAVLFPVNAYPAIKGLFDMFHKANSRMVTLRQN